LSDESGARQNAAFPSDVLAVAGAQKRSENLRRSAASGGELQREGTQPVAVRFCTPMEEQFSKKYFKRLTISLDKKWNEFNMWRKVVRSGW
jgi:hypothetical protein